jgi:nucleotide-binding universal stress UspA family protein
MNGVVVGIDGSPGSATALRFALEEARLRGTTLQVVLAWQAPAMTYADGAGASANVGIADLSAELKSQAGKALDAALADLDVGDVPLEEHVLEGHPAGVLLEAAAGADLLVVGSRGQGGFARLLLGSVGHEVAHHAPCPTVIVPTPTDPNLT